jgi:hypothetical protein
VLNSEYHGCMPHGSGGARFPQKVDSREITLEHRGTTVAEMETGTQQVYEQVCVAGVR